MALLQAFLSGLSFADLIPGAPSFWDFSRWFQVRARTSTTFPWAHIEETAGIEQAVDIYFRYLDEFRSNKCSEIAEVFPPFCATFLTIVNGEHVPPDVPERMSLVRLTPSEVIFLSEHYPERPVPETDAFPSVVEAYEKAKRKWGVAHDRWTATGVTGAG